MSSSWASTGRQWISGSHYRQTNGCIVTSFQGIGLAVFIPKKNSAMLFEASWKWASMIRERFFVLWVWYLNSRHGRCDTYLKSSPPFRPEMLASTLLRSVETEGHRSVNDLCPCILDNETAGQLHWAIMEVMAAIMCTNGSDDIAATSTKWVSTQPQRLLVLHHGHPKCCASASIHNQSIAHLCWQKCYWQYHYGLKMSINGALTISSNASWISEGLCNRVNP